MRAIDEFSSPLNFNWKYWKFWYLYYDGEVKVDRWIMNLKNPRIFRKNWEVALVYCATKKVVFVISFKLEWVQLNIQINPIRYSWFLSDMWMSVMYIYCHIVETTFSYYLIVGEFPQNNPSWFSWKFVEHHLWYTRLRRIIHEGFRDYSSKLHMKFWDDRETYGPKGNE